MRIICNGYNSTFSEAQNIQAVEDLHRAVVSEREKITDDTSITSLQLTYKLSNGKVLMREYTLPNASARLAQIEQVLNSDEARTTRNTPGAANDARAPHLRQHRLRDRKRRLSVHGADGRAGARPV